MHNRPVKKVSPQRSVVLKILRQIKPLLGEKYGVTKLGVFGSVARNEATEKRDVDIVMETERSDLFLSVHIKEELEQAL